MSYNPYLDPVLEMKVLAYLTDQRFSTYLSKIKPLFFTGDRKSLFEAIRKSYMDYGEVTPEAVERITGKPYPTELDTVLVGNSLDILLDNLHLMALRRETRSKGEELIALAESRELTFETVMGAIELEPLLDEDDGSLIEAAQDVRSMYHLKATGKYQFIKTGYFTLDSWLGAEWPAETMLIGGTPGTGKTTLALCTMSRMARKYGTRSTMLNLEMNKDRLLSRMAADLAEIDYSDILAGTLTEEEERRLDVALDELVTLPTDIVCARGKDVGWLVSKIREYALQGSKVFFIDHLQLIESSSDDRNTALGEIVNQLKNASNKYGVRIIILTQLTDKGGGKWVVRDSGAVDSKVDTFMIMSAENDYDTRSIKFTLPKNRDGKPSESGFTLLLNAPWQRFIDPYESRLEKENHNDS